MELAEENKFTIENIYSLPEGKRAELVDGNLYMMAPPNRRHQELVGALYRVIGNHIAFQGLGQSGFSTFAAAH